VTCVASSFTELSGTLLADRTLTTL